MSDRSMASARQPEAPFQGRLFARPVSSYVTDTEKDYGQWGYTRDVSTTAGERHTEGPMDTIKIGNGPPPRSARMKPGVPAPLTDALGNDDQKIEDYKGLNELRRSPLKSMDAYGRYGDYSGIRNAVDDWKAGEFR
jgi:hypothetical protein